MLDLCTGLDTTDGGYLRGQRAQGRSDLFDVGGSDALFEFEQDCNKGWKTSVLREKRLRSVRPTDMVNGHGGGGTMDGRPESAILVRECDHQSGPQLVVFHSKSWDIDRTGKYFIMENPRRVWGSLDSSFNALSFDQ